MRAKAEEGKAQTHGGNGAVLGVYGADICGNGLCDCYGRFFWSAHTMQLVTMRLFEALENERRKKQ